MTDVLHDPRDKNRTASVELRDAFHALEDGEGTTAVLGMRSLSHIRAAHNGIQTIVGILLDREIKLADEADDSAETMAHETATGLLNAIACCTALAEMHTTGEWSALTRTFRGEEGHKVQDFAAKMQGKRGGV